MEANGAGVPNLYDKKSFVAMLRQAKKAFNEGFDILVLPEGQLNPWPESGLLEVFPGAHKLSLMSQRPIRMVALHGLHTLWHADESILETNITLKDVNVRGYDYSNGRMFETGEEFVETFRTVVGHFGAHGVDVPELDEWLDGTAWMEQTRTMHSPPTPTSRKQIGTSMEDIEQAILSTLEREGRDSMLLRVVEQRGLWETEEAQSQCVPVGVHRCKSPLTKYTLTP
jgi:hypothetical protein